MPTGYYEMNERTIGAMQPATSYVVRIDRTAQPGTVLQHLHLSPTDVDGDDETIDSDAVKNATRYDVAAATQQPGSVELQYDIGLVEALRVTGLLQNGGTPIEGVLVELLDSNGDVIAQTLSDANGDYFVQWRRHRRVTPDERLHRTHPRQPDCSRHYPRGTGRRFHKSRRSTRIRFDNWFVRYPFVFLFIRMINDMFGLI
jgi:hypothetical protein